MASLWNDCLAHLERSVPAEQFSTWLLPLRCEADGESGLLLVAPNPVTQRFVRERFLAMISEYVQGQLGKPLAVRVETAARPLPRTNGDATLAPDPADPEDREDGPVSRSDSTAPPVDPVRRPATDEVTRLNPSYTFDSFVRGKANQLAIAAARQVADHPGQAYNPLFIYGGVGLGKTHLAQAIGNQMRERQAQARIRYIHAEQYVADVVRAYQHKAFDSFKRYYHSLDLLLIDDIQFFSGKNRTQEEFFYAFNTLTDAHKQVVITCDTFPRQISGIEDRLITRFAWGLTVELEPPELEMRVAILLKKSHAIGMAVPDDVAFFIARHVQSNVRELEGALKRVHAFARFTGAPAVTLDLVREALKDLCALANRQISLESIQKTVAEYYRIRVADMHSRRRSRSVARPRQMAMAIAKELTDMSLPDIGSGFGGRDHTTVLHAVRKIAELRGEDAGVAQDWQTLLQYLRN
jgi:chromosomal replication initiator protein